MSFTLNGGNVGLVFESTAGTTHTTNVYVIPIWMIIAILAAIALTWWAARKPSRDSSSRNSK